MALFERNPAYRYAKEEDGTEKASTPEKKTETESRAQDMPQSERAAIQDLTAREGEGIGI